MPNIPELPERFAELPGVEMNTPPTETIQQATRLLDAALAHLQEGERGRLVWIAQRHGDQTSVNAALVTKGPKGIKVTAWIGKTWGQPIAVGLAGSKSWS